MLEAEQEKISRDLLNTPLPCHWDQVFSWSFNDKLTTCCCNSLGSKVAMASGSSVHIYDLHIRQEIPLAVFGSESYGLCFSPDGGRLASRQQLPGNRYSVVVYNSTTGDIQWRFDSPKFIGQTVFTPDESKIIVAKSFAYVILDASSGSVMSTHNVSADSGVCLTSDGNTLVVAGKNKIAVIDDLTNLRLTIECDNICSICVSSDGSRVIAGTSDGDIQVFNTKDGARVQWLKRVHRDGVNSLCLSSDNSLFVSGSGDRTVNIWNSVTYALVQTLEGHSSYVWSVCFGPNNVIISGSDDKTVRVWEC